MGLTRFEDLQDWKDQQEGCHSTDYSAHFCLAQGDKLLWPFFSPPLLLELQQTTAQHDPINKSERLPPCRIEPRLLTNFAISTV